MSGKRSFSVYGKRVVLKKVEQTIRWDVYAEDFESAKEAVYNGNYEDYEIQDYDYSELDDEYEILESPSDIDEVQCDDCECYEDSCNCDCEDDEDYDPDYEERISEPGVFVENLERDEWYEPDEYTFARWFTIRGPIKITRWPSGPDSEGDYYIAYEDAAGVLHSEYVRKSAKFMAVEDPSLDPEEAEERRREREEAAQKELQKVKTQVALNDLLAPINNAPF